MLTNVNSIAISPGFAVDHTIFAGSGNGWLYKSTDGGSNWNELSGLGLVSVALSPHFSTDKTVFAGSDYDMVYQSTDGGNSWSILWEGFPHLTYINLVTASPSYASDLTIFSATNRGVWSYTATIPVNNITPTGWITTADTHITADLTDNGSGINSASLSVYLDGSALSSCSLNSAHVDCPVTGLTEGQHNILVNYMTNAGTHGYGAGTFNVDHTNPSISGISPSGWTKAGTNISASLSDSGSGINTAAVSVFMDGSSTQLPGCSVSTSNISCPVSGLAAGHHMVNFIAQDKVGNQSSASGGFDVDAAAPVIAKMSPTGTVTTKISTISASYSDADSGINPASAKLTVNGQDATSYATITADHISFACADKGVQNIHLEISDYVGNVQTADWSFTAPNDYSYYFPWYDNQGGRTWVLGANPTGFPDDSIDSLVGISPLAAGVTIHGGSTVPMFFAGVMGGPIRVDTNNGPALVSERSLFGNSFEEVWATSFEDLDSHYWWPVYDSASMKNWILVANPAENGENITVRVTVHNASPDISETRDLAPGQSWTPIYTARFGGPVEVKAWRQGGDENADPRRVIASQRVLDNGAFNEMPGIPDWQLSPGWFWTWYDNNSPGAKDWICIGNPNPQPTFVAVLVGKQVVFQGYAPANGTLPVQVKSGDPAGIGGPVAAISCSDASCNNLGPNIYATQRVIWGPSFSEISGYGDFKSNVNWTWYDNANPGTTNWVLLSNLNSDRSIYAEIKIAGVPRWAGFIPAFGNVTPTFPGVMAGPVEVNAWDDASRSTPTEVFASQRVLWNGYFNELVGKGF